MWAAVHNELCSSTLGMQQERQRQTHTVIIVTVALRHLIVFSGYPYIHTQTHCVLYLYVRVLSTTTARNVRYIERETSDLDDENELQNNLCTQ